MERIGDSTLSSCRGSCHTPEAMTDKQMMMNTRNDMNLMMPVVVQMQVTVLNSSTHNAIANYLEPSDRYNTLIEDDEATPVEGGRGKPLRAGWFRSSTPLVSGTVTV